MNAACSPSLMALTKPTTRPLASSTASQTKALPCRILRCVSGAGGFGQPAKNPASLSGVMLLSESV